MALAILAREGPSGVRIERLARELGATKGSFYWHFRDRREFDRQMLDEWLRLTNTEILDQVADDGVSAEARLRKLGRLTTKAGEPGGLRELERGVRAWAAFEPAVARRVEAVERDRLAALSGLFRAHGFSPAEAETRAYLFVFYVAGDAVSAVRDSPARRERLMKRRLDLLLER